MLCLCTRDDDPQWTYITDLPGLQPHGRSGVALEQAAEKMNELRDFERDVPLEGEELEAAARRFADARGLAVRDFDVQVDDSARQSAVAEALSPDSHPELRRQAQAQAKEDLAAADAAAEDKPAASRAKKSHGKDASAGDADQTEA